MCLLIVNPSRLAIPFSVLETAVDANPDGFGCAFSRRGDVVVKKSAGHHWASFDRFCGVVERFRPQIVHFRFATHGDVCKRLCHPFPGNGWAMAHNGILPISDIRDGESDTSELAGILRDSNPRDYLDVLGDLCGESNKLGFVFGDGSTEIVGESLGEWRDGIWYSNSSGFARSSCRYALADFRFERDACGGVYF